MTEIRNKSRGKLSINLKSGKIVDLFQGGTAVVSDEDFNSSQLQNLLAKENVIISSKGEETKEKSDYKPKQKPKPDVSEIKEPSENVVDESIEKSEYEEKQQAESVSGEPENVSREIESVSGEPETVVQELSEIPDSKKGKRKYR